ncbi:Ribonuclease III [Lactobacillus selangorensis]|uniref:Ribonuclease III n=1 Tax=Lactobacillus selangorensis TaxID=81857 RepID=A0A0R2FG36_9LACO|nr:glycosyltransferase family 2 protein [Lactobacillus selangorensis]KRN27555.1 Ribonuclease III [Lactobacillus selangorensis]KRN30172.1 Ribonuclease III [Lactobacillus selangorensis]
MNAAKALPKLTIILPCYNEQEVLPITQKVVLKQLQAMIAAHQVADSSRILFVNDGSSDQTWQLITSYTQQDPHFTGLKFSRNFGHQNALIAGMTVAVKDSDCLITIDADLQDDVSKMPDFIQAYHAGYDVVYGVRDSRKTDTAFKRDTALLFYRLMGKLGVQMVPDSADYRLMSKRATEAFLEFKERNLFLRGIIPLVGFPSTKVYYPRHERAAGKSKYPLQKMIKFAMTGITSFSIVPMTLLMNLGFLCVLIAIGVMIYTLVQKISGNVVTGWASLMMSLWFLGGVQLIGMGILGDYIGKIFTEVKRRPRFIIEEDLYTPHEHQKPDKKEFVDHAAQIDNDNEEDA